MKDTNINLDWINLNSNYNVKNVSLGNLNAVQYTVSQQTDFDCHLVEELNKTNSTAMLVPL